MIPPLIRSYIHKITISLNIHAITNGNFILPRVKTAKLPDGESHYYFHTFPLQKSQLPIGFYTQRERLSFRKDLNMKPFTYITNATYFPSNGTVYTVNLPETIN
jgi:hypothetical protein